jgi:hypothetical protein
MGKPSSIVSAVLNQGIRHRPGVVIVIVALMKRQRTYAAASLLVGALAMVLSTSLVANAIPNKHRIPIFVVDVLKIPYNFCFNVLGLEFWTNTNADTIMATPTWVVNFASLASRREHSPVRLLRLRLAAPGRSGNSARQRFRSLTDSAPSA